MYLVYTAKNEFLEKMEKTQPQESIGLAPNTPPPDFLPPELM